METSLAESQTDSCFPTKWPNGYPKQKYVSDTHIQKTNYNKNKPWQKNRLGTVSKKYFTEGLKSILRGHNSRPYFCRGLETYFVLSAWRLPNSSVLHLREHKKTLNLLLQNQENFEAEPSYIALGTLGIPGLLR